MSKASVTALATDAALALASHHLGSPATVGDARLFSSGLLRLWQGWASLAEPDKGRIARFLRLRPDVLAEDWAFLRAATDSIDRQVRFRWSGQPGEDPLRRPYEPVPGKPVERLIDELLDELDERRRERFPTEIPSGAGNAPLRLRDGSTSFCVPPAHVPPLDAGWPVLEETGSDAPVHLRRDRLLEIAARMDAARLTSAEHARVVARFLDDTCLGLGGRAFGSGVEVRPGPTQLVAAPTGRGKSVLARVVSLDAAARGLTVALVLPDIKEVLKEAHALERFAQALGLPVRVTPVNSPRSLIEKAAEFLEHPPDHDPHGAWTMDRLGYPCRLSAYADPPAAVEPGREPCFRLRHGQDGRERTVVCPFAKGCPKFDTYKEAFHAQILVVNHAAFLTGRVPMPLHAGGGPRTKMSVMELVLRRSSLVLIDEVDLFQRSAVKGLVGTLQISSRPKVSPAHQLLMEFEECRAADELPPDVPVERAQRQMHLVPWLAGLLSGLLNGGGVAWPEREGMRWPGGKDGWISARLFGGEPDAHDRFEALFAAAPIAGDPHAERLRRAVRDWVEYDLEDDRDTRDLRAALAGALTAWPRPLVPQASRRNEAVARVSDALILKVLLSRLEQALNRLRPQLATLEQLGLETASTMRDELLGYVPWRPAPTGALGRRIVGFSFKRHGDEPGSLHAQTLAGDPHGFVSTLGEDVSLALVGKRRVVIGLSATARFSGSPDCDVTAPVLLVQPDVDGGVLVEDGSVRDTAGDGEPLKVSGVTAARGRLERADRLGYLLWEGYLRHHLSALAANEETRSRARALLVTGSYDEARVVAQALSRAIGNVAIADDRVRYLASERTASDGKQVVLPRELEAFGASGADVLVAPLAVVSRGHNILQPNAAVSAIASIFVLVRPVPPADDAARALSHVSYDAVRSAGPAPVPGAAITATRRRAEQALRYVQRNAGAFGTMPADLRHHVLCDVLVDLAQLAGRARRGGTDVRLFLVDAAFHVDHVGWRQLLAQTFARWRSEGALDEMVHMHKAFLSGLRRFAGLEE